MPIFCKYESVLRTYHYYLKKYCQFWCQKVSGELLSEVLGSSKGETFGVAPVGRGGAFGVAGVGLVGRF